MPRSDSTFEDSMAEKQWNKAKILSAPIDGGCFGPGQVDLGFKSHSDDRAALIAFFGGQVLCGVLVTSRYSDIPSASQRNEYEISRRSCCAACCLSLAS
jgi:hypothetical protein